jgi:hypothetical protein
MSDFQMVDRNLVLDVINIVVEASSSLWATSKTFTYMYYPEHTLGAQGALDS